MSARVWRGFGIRGSSVAHSKSRSVSIYVEGGGNPETDLACRRGFRTYLMSLGLDGRLPRVRSYGDRDRTIERFREAVAGSSPDDLPILLVDSDQALSANDLLQPMNFLRRVGIDLVSGTSIIQYHGWVQCFETWLVADPAALEQFYGSQGFDKNKLPKHTNLESIPPKELEQSLINATRGTGVGKYSKGQHAFAILAYLDPTKISGASPWAKRFHQTLLEVCRPPK